MWLDLSKKIHWIVTVMGSCFLCIFFITLIANYFEIKIYHDSLWGIIKGFTILFFLPMYIAYKAMFIFGYVKEQSEINIYSETFWGILVITQWMPATMGWVCANNLYKEISIKKTEQAYYEQSQSPIQKPWETDWNQTKKVDSNNSLQCESKRYKASKYGLDFYGLLQYSIQNKNPIISQLNWGVTNYNPELAPSSTSGSIRVELRALPKSIENSLESYVIGTYYPNFSNTTDFLNVGAYASNIVSTAQSTNIPVGNYCIVALLQEYSEDCITDDHYCGVAWIQFENAENF
nr:hypothetical protein [Acinetobacter lwoffii]